MCTDLFHLASKGILKKITLASYTIKLKMLYYIGNINIFNQMSCRIQFGSNIIFINYKYSYLNGQPNLFIGFICYLVELKMFVKWQNEQFFFLLERTDNCIWFWLGHWVLLWNYVALFVQWAYYHSFLANFQPTIHVPRLSMTNMKIGI